MSAEFEQAHDEAFRAVVAHRTMLKAYIRAIIFDPDLAEDTFSEAVLEIVRYWDRYDQSRPFAPWARGIARRVALLNLREQKRQLPFLLDEAVLEEVAEEIDEAGQEWELARRKSALRHCLRRLSGKNQELIRLRYFQERSYSQMARTVGRTVGALYAVFCRLEKALLRCVEHRLTSPEQNHE
jgi:RNA polymerase sigma-70 factor (ECF subfamily)